MRRTITAALVAAALALAGCGSSPPAARPPTVSALAAKLGCRVTWAGTSGQWAYDTTQYANAGGGPCSDGTIATSGITIIIIASPAKEADWLRQNSIAESSSFPDGFYELAVGHLWAAADAGGGATPGISQIVSILGGRETTF